MDKLEKKFGKLAVPHLTVVLLAAQAIGFLLYYTVGDTFLIAYLTLDPYRILHGELWRLVSWIIIPANLDVFSFILVAALFYFPIGTQMERIWGNFRYTLYIFLGILFSVAGAFLLYAYVYLSSGGRGISVEGLSIGMGMSSIVIGANFSPYFVMLSIFFAFAATFPESMVLFMFLVPVKMKWMGIGYGAYLLWLIATGDVFRRVLIIASVLNFVVFFLWAKGSAFQRYRPQEVKRRREFQQSMRMTPPAHGAHHRCSVCGATDEDHPDYEFRYCSKCNGAFEYCQEHLFTHVHKS